MALAADAAPPPATGPPIAIAGRVLLKAGRDGPVRGGNPWIFSQAIARVEPPALQAGEWVEVRDAGGDLLGLGYFNPATTIAVRILAFDAALAPGDVIRERIRRALALRQRIIQADTDCYRLINGDGDGLSGVVVDRYGGVLVMQLMTAGADRMRAELVAALRQIVEPQSIVERSHGAVRKQEGLADHAEVLAGAPPAETLATEHGIRLAIDLDRGQKTGAFLDQRDNRATLRGLARGARVLDAYCYAGGFTLAALAGGARQVVAVDSSDRALAMARRNLELNFDRVGRAEPVRTTSARNGRLASADAPHDRRSGSADAGVAEFVRSDSVERPSAERAEFVRADVLRYLADLAPVDRFDLIVLDPPPLARSLKDAPHAARLYTDLNAFAMRALAPGGYLMTFSCSIHFRGEDFVRAVRIAQTKSGRKLRILARLGPSPDHPTLLGHAEGEYLTGLLLADLA